MPKASDNTQSGPWYKRIRSLAHIALVAIILLSIIISAVENAAEKKANASRQPQSSYEEIFTPEEQERMGIGAKIDGPGDWKPDPNAAERFHNFINNGGAADPAIDAIQDGDYHDLLDQNGGPEGY